MPEHQSVPKVIISRPVRYAVVAVGVLIGLGLFAYSRKVWPFEVRHGTARELEFLDGGYRQERSFDTAFRMVEAHPVVTAALGVPVTDAGLQRYQPILQSAGKRHDYVIDLEGPNGAGVATVSVEELAGRYRVTSARFITGAGEAYDLLAAN